MTNLQYEWREVAWGYSGSCVVYPGDFCTMFQPHMWAFLLGLKYSTEVGGVGGQGMVCVIHGS